MNSSENLGFSGNFRGIGSYLIHLNLFNIRGEIGWWSITLLEQFWWYFLDSYHFGQLWVLKNLFYVPKCFSLTLIVKRMLTVLSLLIYWKRLWNRQLDYDCLKCYCVKYQVERFSNTLFPLKCLPVNYTYCFQDFYCFR